MSQPPIDPSFGYQPNYQAPEAPRRPTSVTVLAINGIILGALGTICSPFALLPYFVQMGPPQPAIEAVKNDPSIFTYLVASTALGWVMAIVLLVSSIAALAMREWARKGMLAYAWVTLVTGLIGLVATFAWVNPKIAAAPNVDRATMLGQQIGAIVGGLIILIFPTFVLIFMNRPRVKDAFARADANLV